MDSVLNCGTNEWLVIGERGADLQRAGSRRAPHSLNTSSLPVAAVATA